jgi:proteasome lid subunit RPN8/RPN11
MLTKLHLTDHQKQQMLKYLEKCLPEEACGLIGGHDDQAEVVLPVANELHSSVRYRMDPVEQLKNMIWIEDQGFDLLAIFHSHPMGPDIPSETDIKEFTYPGTITMIWSKETGEWKVRGFQIQDDHYREIQLLWV